MDLSGQASQARFASYVEALVEVIGHADRAEPLNDYCVGLLMPGERKSVEPMAAIGAGPGFRQTSIAFTSGRPGALVGRGRFAKDPRAGFAWHRTTRADRSLDRR